jgi:hypothetical protein
MFFYPRSHCLSSPATPATLCNMRFLPLQVSPEVALLQRLSSQVTDLTALLKQTQQQLSRLGSRVSNVENALEEVQQAAGDMQGLRQELAGQGKRLGILESATGRLQVALSEELYLAYSR